ncbi:MAG: GTP-binding protein, partial [Lachnospiraceae bacterium]|nr:GTP-binding protein [Lachnospiraceae bacterium]
DRLEGTKILETIEDAKDLEAELMKEVMEAHEEEHHHHHHDHDEHHHHNDEEEHEHHHDHEHEEHEHHHHDHEDHDHDHGPECTCGCHDHDHHHHDADEVFTSIGIETSTKYTKEKVEDCLEALDDTGKYGTVLRCKGMLPTETDRFIHFDYVPGECEVRDGAAEVTGKVCVIGSDLKEEAIRELFV